MNHFDTNETAERFIRYASVFTQSREGVPDTPSTPCQRDLAKLLYDELVEMGAADVYYDEDKCYVYATLPSNLTLSKEQEESAKLDKLLSQGKETEPLYDIPYVVSVSRNDDLTRFWGESDPDFLKKALVKGVMILHGI